MIGPVVFLWLGLSILTQIRQQPSLDHALQSMREAFEGERLIGLLTVVALMFVNWGIEARKWQLSLRPLYRLSFLQAFKATLGGSAVSLTTPNRVGEYAGRILFLREEYRWRAIGLTVVAGWSQLLVTLVAGAAGLLVMRTSLKAVFGTYHDALWTWLLAMTLFAIILITTVYFRPHLLLKAIRNIPLLKKIAAPLSVVEEMRVTILLRVLNLSFLRYLIFTVQYVFLLSVMGVEIPLEPAFWLVTILHLLLTVVPSVALIELGVRGKVSILLLKLYSSNIVGIYATATGIWMINLVLPALAGSLLIAGVKIFNDRR